MRIPHLVDTPVVLLGGKQPPFRIRYLLVLVCQSTRSPFILKVTVPLPMM